MVIITVGTQEVQNVILFLTIFEIRLVEQFFIITSFCVFIPFFSIIPPQVCNSCTGPNEEALRQAIDHLQAGIPKALVVLLGPIHVSSAYQQKANLLK